MSNLLSNLFGLGDEQISRLKPHLTKSHGSSQGDDKRLFSSIIFIIRNGWRWL